MLLAALASEPAAAAAPNTAAAALLAGAAQPSGPFAGAWFGLEEDGAIGHLGAAAGRAIPAPRPGAAPADRARAFVIENRDAFGLPAAGDLAVESSSASPGRTYQRLQQSIGGVAVLGGEMIVQLDGAANVQAVQAHLARASVTGSFVPAATPAIDSTRAKRSALAEYLRETPGGRASPRGAERLVFVPSLFGVAGPPRDVWAVTLVGPGPQGGECVLVDARDGSLAWRYPLQADALARTVFDANNGANNGAFVQVRAEGGAPAALAAANNIYDYLGDIYTFYQSRFGRDSYDGAGAPLWGVARYCGFGATFTSCNNASFTVTDTMYVGPGFDADDVIGHEVTHGVTGRTSRLVYANESGAINESMSDIFGELMDLTNGHGTDTPAVRWLMGEDIPGGPLRNMADPTTSKSGAQPDRRNSPNYVPPAATPNQGNDFGGVHTNSGISNKLCYLLTDGATFNGQTVNGMGITPVAALFYETNAHLLVSSSGWTDLFFALRQAAVNLGWSDADQNNVYRGCVAVEIATSTDVYADAASPCSESGSPVCIFSLGPSHTLGNAAIFARPGDLIHMAAGAYHEALPLTISKTVLIQATGGTVTVGN